MQCTNHLKQLGLALHNYHDTHGSFPPDGLPTVNNVQPSKIGMFGRLLPFIEQQALFDNIRYDGNWQTNMPLSEARIDGYLCPSGPHVMSKGNNEQDFYTTHYYGNAGPLGTNPLTGTEYSRDTANEGNTHGQMANGGVFHLEKISFRDIADGTSNTIGLGEISYTNYTHYRSWIRAPYLGSGGGGTGMMTAKGHRWAINSANDGTITLRTNEGGYGSHHPGGANFGHMDGSVRFLSETVDMETYRAMASRAGGEVAGF